MRPGKGGLPEIEGPLSTGCLPGLLPVGGCVAAPVPLGHWVPGTGRRVAIVGVSGSIVVGRWYRSPIPSLSGVLEA